MRGLGLIQVGMLGVASILLAYASLAYAPLAYADFGAAERGPDLRFEQHRGAELPQDVLFKDEAGQARALKDFGQGRPRVFVLAYYGCPNLCTLVLNSLIGSLRDLHLNPGQDYDLIVVSIDPSETPSLARAKKASYLRRFGRGRGAEQGFHFLTGDGQSIRALADAAGFHFAKNPRSGAWEHPSGIWVASPKGTISRYFFGIEYPSAELEQSLRIAARGGLGAWAESIRLYCIEHDPLSGKYGVLISQVARALALATVLGLLFFVIRLSRTPVGAVEGEGK